MAINSITSFLIPPGKNSTTLPSIQGTSLNLDGKLFQMLSDLYDKSDSECETPIRFVMSPNGTQSNPMRSLVIAYLENPSVDHGLHIAERLSRTSNKTSGLGLLFIILGIEGPRHKIVISRFHAEQGVLADIHGQDLEIEFIERIFMKNSLAYKAALYSDRSPRSGFWEGKVVDKQINYAGHGIAQYWINDFLASDFVTTSEMGTRRFAIAIREASKKAKDLTTRQNIVSLGLLVRNFEGARVTIQGILDNFHMPEDVKNLVVGSLQQKSIASETFVFNNEEFLRNAVYRSIELDNGGTLIARTDVFNECFPRQLIDNSESTYRFTSTGKIVDERIRGNK